MESIYSGLTRGMIQAENIRKDRRQQLMGMERYRQQSLDRQTEEARRQAKDATAKEERDREFKLKQEGTPLEKERLALDKSREARESGKMTEEEKNRKLAQDAQTGIPGLAYHLTQGWPVDRAIKQANKEELAKQKEDPTYQPMQLKSAEVDPDTGTIRLTHTDGQKSSISAQGQANIVNKITGKPLAIPKNPNARITPEMRLGAKAAISDYYDIASATPSSLDRVATRMLKGMSLGDAAEPENFTMRSNTASARAAAIAADYQKTIEGSGSYLGGNDKAQALLTEKQAALKAAYKAARDDSPHDKYLGNDGITLEQKVTPEYHPSAIGGQPQQAQPQQQGNPLHDEYDGLKTMLDKQGDRISPSDRLRIESRVKELEPQILSGGQGQQQQDAPQQ